MSVTFINMSRKKTTEEIIAEFRDVHGDRYDYRDVVYDGGKVKVVIWCKKHNHPFQQAPVKHKAGQGCDICAEEARDAHRRSSGHTTQSFIKRARELHGDRYDYSEVEYTGYDCTIMIGCPDHGLQPVIAYQHIASDVRRGCKICSSTQSKHAAAIERFLIEENYEYIKEWSDHDCKDKNKLRFDFYLPKQRLIIEYDGDQHFRPANWSRDDTKNKMNFLNGRRRDAIKSIWCKANKINLMRITSNVDLDEIPDYLDYMIDSYSGRERIDIRFLPTEWEIIEKDGIEAFLEYLKQRRS